MNVYELFWLIFKVFDLDYIRMIRNYSEYDRIVSEWLGKYLTDCKGSGMILILNDFGIFWLILNGVEMFWMILTFVGITRYGMTWYDMDWYGTVWCDHWPVASSQVRRSQQVLKPGEYLDVLDLMLFCQLTNKAYSAWDHAGWLDDGVTRWLDVHIRCQIMWDTILIMLNHFI